jgi:hypothetical protein
MKAYLFLAIGVLWIAIAVILNRTGWSFFWRKGAISPATAAMILRLAPPIFSFGWIVPTALGLWLLVAKR